MSSAPTNQLNNITNSTLVSSNKASGRKPDSFASRTASREKELQQKLKNNMQKENSKETPITSSQTETTNIKKEFKLFKFYLDNLDQTSHGKIERGLKLLGAEPVTFFSNKVTHMITNKTIPKQETSDTNTSTATKPLMKKVNKGSVDQIIERALSWGIKVWSQEETVKHIEYLMQASPSKNYRQKSQPQEKRALGKVLQEEKIFGPSTGANSESQAKRPQLVPFTGHFILLEDSSHLHRPPISKQYTKEILKKRCSEYPWPHLKNVSPMRSPFGKRAPPTEKEAAAIKAKQEEAKKAVVEAKEKTPRIENKLITPPATPGIFVNDSQMSLRASGFNPMNSATNNTTLPTRSTQILHVRLPPGDPVNRLDKRMVENVTQNEDQKLRKQAHKQERDQREAKRQKEKEQQKKKDLRFCENCNVQFENLEDHINDETHQTFIRDQNNFKELDRILEKTRRTYKKPLPEHFKNLIDYSVDSKEEIIFELSKKRSRAAAVLSPPAKLNTPLMQTKQETSPPPLTENTKASGWDQYHHVFLG